MMVLKELTWARLHVFLILFYQPIPATSVEDQDGNPASGNIATDENMGEENATDSVVTAPTQSDPISPVTPLDCHLDLPLMLLE